MEHYSPPVPPSNISIFTRLLSKLSLALFWTRTQFTHNFKYLYTSEPDPLHLTSDASTTHLIKYRKIVDHALRKHLLGYDYVRLMNDYHRTPLTEQTFNDALALGDLPDHPLDRDSSYTRARQRAKDLLSPPVPIRPVHFTDLLQYPWNDSPSAELPFAKDPVLLKRLNDARIAGTLPNAKPNFGNLKNVIFDDVRTFIHQVKRRAVKLDPTNRHIYPDRLHVKPMISTKDKNKLRIIFGRSKRFILPEAMFFWPYFRWLLQDRFSDDHNPLLWGCETLLGGWSRLNTFYSIRNLYYSTFVTLDLSKFDQRALFSIIGDCTNDWYSFFSFQNGYIPTTEYPQSSTDPDKLKAIFDFIIWSITNVPFLHPSGKVFQRLHRYIPSGLFVTQFLDSHYNLIICLTCLDAAGIDINTVHIRVQGDDSIIALRIYIPSSQHENFMSFIESELLRRFDASLSRNKSLITNSPQQQVVLGYSNNNGFPTRDWLPLLATLLHPRSTSPQLETLMSQCPGLIYASIYERNVVNVCTDIFNYLDSIGIKPSGQAYDLVALSQSAGFDADLTKLPTLNDVTRYLRSPPSVRPSHPTNKEYWPTAFFLSPY
jgi:hypothetical protein